MIMKVIHIVIVAFLSFLLFSCSDDDNDSLDFSGSALEQTKWTGTLDQSYMSNGMQQNDTYLIGVIFYTGTEGKTSVTLEPNPNYSYDSDFTFSIKGKSLIITNGGKLEGYWLLVESNHKKMVLEQGTGGDASSKKVLTLNRLY